MSGCLRFVGVLLLLIAAGCIWILVKIKGTSDGPGALFFWIGAAGGLWGAWLCLVTLQRTR